MTGLNPKDRVVEVRRYRFRSHNDLRPHLKGVRLNPLPGGEYQINPEDYLSAVNQLKRIPNIELVTARDIQNDLGWIQYQEVRESPQLIPVEDPENWTYLSPITRRWRRCLVSNGKLLARPGWALAKHHKRGRAHYYFYERDKDIDECRMVGNRAIRRAYEGVLGTLPIPYWADGKFLSSLWPRYVIPKEHESFLTGAMLPMDELITSNDGEAIWIWHPNDQKDIEDTLRGLRFRLVPWDPEKDWVETISIIMKRSYGTYFRRRGGAAEFQLIMRQRAWHAIDDPILKEIIKNLCEAEWEGDNAATALQNFIANQLCVDLDWQEYNEEIEGWVIESSPVFYSQHTLAQRYYRVVIPQFETVLGWETRRHPEWEGENRPRIRIFHWRSAPYVGRLKTGGGQSREPIPGKAGRELKEKSLRSMLGLPTIEWQLANELAVGAFVLDLDGAHWKGCNDLCRYFSGYGKAISLNPAECDGYGILFEDAIGQRFVLETHALSRDLLPDQGDWVHFVAYSSLLQHRAWIRLKRNVPVFEIAMPHIFRRAYESEALKNSILAIVKYQFGTKEEDIQNSFEQIWGKESVLQAIQSLIESSNILVLNNHLYYRYSPFTLQEMKALITEGSEKTENQPFNKIRTLLHPLYVRTLRLGEIANIITPDQYRRIRTVYISAKIKDSELLRRSIENINKFGIGKIAARGGQAQRGKAIIKSLVEINPHLQIRRKDGIHVFDDGGEAEIVEFLIRDPLRELQIRFE